MKRLLSLAAFALAITAACSDSDRDGTATPDVSVSATATTPAETPTPTPVPEVINGIAVKPLSIAAATPLPDDLALYLESGCWGCDGPAAALERVYRAPDGAVRTEDLFRLPGATVQKPEVDSRYIMSIAPGRDGDLLLSMCDGPYCGGVGHQAPGAKTSIWHSADGGITWKNELTVDGGAYVIANYGGASGGKGFGLLRIYAPGDQPEPEKVRLAYYPTLETEPVKLGGLGANEARILVPANGPPLLRGEDGISFYRLEGGPESAPWFRFDSLPGGSVVVDLQFLSDSLLVTWAYGGHAYTAFMDGNRPETSPKLTEIFRWPDSAAPSFHRPQGGFAGNRAWVVAINGTRGQLPSSVDFDAAAIRPFAELVERSNSGDRLLVKSVALGPFARVKGVGEGDCLNVRQSPSLSSTTIACYGDGVLLQELGQHRDADGKKWLFVLAPQERQGWASAEFLETGGDAPWLSWHPAGTRTGTVEVDAIIAALEESAFVPQSLVGWRPIACRVPGAEQGIGGPPVCPEGVADQTPVDVIAGGSCEGYWVPKPPGGEPVRLIVGPEQRLYAVGKLDPAQQYPRGEYVLIYVSPAHPEFGQAIYVTDGKVIDEWSGCGTSPVDILKDAAGVVFPPFAP